jgi:hypothetical protein
VSRPVEILIAYDDGQWTTEIAEVPEEVDEAIDYEGALFDWLHGPVWDDATMGRFKPSYIVIVDDNPPPWLLEDMD